MEQVKFNLESVGEVEIESIGKIVFETKKDWNLPHLHFMTLYSFEDKCYHAWCLELNSVVSGSSLEEASQYIFDSCSQFINSFIREKKDLLKLAEIFSNTECEDLWGYFRKFDVCLAMEGKNIGSYFTLDKDKISKDSHMKCITNDTDGNAIPAKMLYYTFAA